MTARSWNLSPSAYTGLALLLVFIAAAVLGPVLAGYPPERHLLDTDQYFLPPSGAHWLGTNHGGDDLLTQLLYGARLALFMSVSVVAISAAIGITVGTISGYFGGWVDEVIMRIVDVVMAFPGLLLNIAIVALVARPGVGMMVVALIANGWVGYARVARGQVLSLREREYVTAARCIGVSAPRIMSRHIVPNLMSPIIVQMTFGLGTVILVEASLTFLGLGPQIAYSWGAILKDGVYNLVWSHRPALVSGAAIMIVVLGANLLGDGLRDRFDPSRSRDQR